VRPPARGPAGAPRHTGAVSEAPVPVDGWCHPRFAAVRNAFVTNFAERGEVGGAVCVIVDGEIVVDLFGGWADQHRSHPWRPDTLVNVYSASKGLLAMMALQLVESGQLGLDTPVADIWPEFAAGGKDRATVRHALSHQAGVPAIRAPLTNDDLWSWERMTAALAATEAWFEPGTRVVYHTNTYGHLVGEIIRRAGGSGPAATLRELADPLDADAWYALPAAAQVRCADVIFEPPAALREAFARDAASLDGDGRMIALAYANPPGYGSQGVMNSVAWRSAEVPAANGHATANALARLYAALLVPDKLISTDLLAEATRVQASGHCPVLGEDISYGLGFVPTTARRPLGGPRGFGHFGTGGALGFADPDAGVAFGYVMNHVIPRWQSTRNRALIDALYTSL
jgi:CubicO group peptidase (beta-lactamase class C family)